MVKTMYKYHRSDVEWSEFAIKEIFKTFIGTNGIQTPTGSYIKKSKFKKSAVYLLSSLSKGIKACTFISIDASYG